jgi:exosortase A-associated hydrolase 2
MLKPYFLDTPQGHLFIQAFTPIASTTEAVIFVPPFAEEMNKSRRMMAMLGHALSANGTLMVIPDLYGTGDSEGEFVEANWDIWLENIQQLIQKLKQQGIQDISLVGLRMGCLLISDYLLLQQGNIKQVVFWKPVLSGQQMLNQFLRLRVANSMMNGEKETTKSLRDLLAKQGEIEVAGYQLNAELVSALDGKKLVTRNIDKNINWFWFEVLASSEQPVPIASQRILETSREAGVQISLEKVVGESFWANQEITELPNLINSTCRLFYET